MNRKLAEPFSLSFLNVMPQLGMSPVELKSIEECDKQIETPGVVVIVGIVGDLHGNVLFALSEESAKKIASTMMMMDVLDFDDMAQSAVSELSNMLAANACIEFSGTGIFVDISTPTLMHGVFTANASYDNVIRIEMDLEGMPFYIYVSIEQK